VIIHATSIQRQMPLPDATIAYAAARAALGRRLRPLEQVSNGAIMPSAPPGFLK
jgi:hypothetical protein